MPTLIDRLLQRSVQRAIENNFNQAFYKTVGTHATSYDTAADVYLEEGYLNNPIVNAVVKQRAKKALQIPFYVKRIKEKDAKKQLDFFNQSTKWNPKPQQFIKKLELKAKAYEEEVLDFPMERPNALQTWGDIIGLYETFMPVTGNFYLYLLRGDISSEPLAVYVLPSHQMEIVLKADASTLGIESPIDYYTLTEGNTAIRFEAEDIIHIKNPNPDYDQNGAHLYGLSELRAGLRNVQSSNLGLDLNTDTMLNGGAFGFIHGMETPLTDAQAKGVKDRLKEMRNSKDVLGKIQGSSAKLGFTQVRLSAQEMQLFDYFQFDQKMICNVLGWDDKLLNNDAGAKYDNVELAEQRVVVNTTMPSLQLLDEALTDKFLPLFKGYEGTVFEHDPSELPEMQKDMKSLMEWLSIAINQGVMNRATAQKYLGLEVEENELMKQYTVNADVLTLEEALNSDFILNEPQNLP